MNVCTHRPTEAQRSINAALRTYKPNLDQEGELQCHELVAIVMRLAPRNPKWGQITAVEWDETKWGAVAQALRDAVIARPAGLGEVISHLLDDIADESVNGHSFLLHANGAFIDPWLSLQGVDFHEIQRAAGYLYCIFKLAGMSVPPKA